MAAIDCLRGLMLTIVLADHIDYMALNGGSIRSKSKGSGVFD